MNKKPWKTPQRDDTLTFSDGRVWTVTSVESPGRRPGEERVGYDYVDVSGTRRKAWPMKREFEARMARLVREGAVYERGRRVLAIEVPVVDELPVDGRVGSAVACGRQVFVMTDDDWLLVVPAEMTEAGR